MTTSSWNGSFVNSVWNRSTPLYFECSIEFPVKHSGSPTRGPWHVPEKMGTWNEILHLHANLVKNSNWNWLLGQNRRIWREDKEQQGKRLSAPLSRARQSLLFSPAGGVILVTFYLLIGWRLRGSKVVLERNQLVASWLEMLHKCLWSLLTRYVGEIRSFLSTNKSEPLPHCCGCFTEQIPWWN